MSVRLRASGEVTPLMTVRAEKSAQLSRKYGFDKPVGVFFGMYGSGLFHIGGLILTGRSVLA